MISSLSLLLPGLGASAIFVACGLGISAFSRALKARPLAIRLAFAYLLGMAWVSGGMFLAGHFLDVRFSRTSFLVLAIVPFVAGLRKGLGLSRPVSRPGPTRPRKALAFAALAVAGLVFFGILCDVVATVQSGWDSKMIWLTQARYLRASGKVHAPVFYDEKAYLAAPRYPILMPIVNVAVQEIFDTKDDERIPRVVYALFLPVLLALVFDGAARRAGRDAAWCAVLTLALIPNFSFVSDGSASTGYSDLPLGAFLGAGALVLDRRRLDFPTALAGGLLLGAAVFTKTEGAPLAAIAIAAIAFGQWRRGGASKGSSSLRQASRLIPALALLFVLIVTRQGWSRAIPDRYSAPFVEDPGRLLRQTIERIPKLVLPIWRELEDAPTWGHFWWSAPLIFAAGARGWRARGMRSQLALTIGALGFYAVAYGGTYWILEHLIHSTWNRFMIQMSVPLFCVFAGALGATLRALRAGRGSAWG